MTVEIRHADHRDIGTLSRFAAKTFPLACPPGIARRDIESFVQSTLSIECFERYVADPTRTVLVASSGESIRAYAILVSSPPESGRITDALQTVTPWELNKFFVARNERGSGLAGNLMAEVVRIAGRAGAQGIWLGVNRDNQRANRFYEKNGFGVVGSKEFTIGSRTLVGEIVRERRL